MLKLLTCGAVLACTLSLLPGVAYATPISGELNITGDVSVGATTIDWLPTGGGTGTFAVTQSSTGDFAGLAGQSGTMKDLDELSVPVGTDVSVTDFITLPGNISFELTKIDAGVFTSAQCGAAPAAGQVCTPDFPAPKSPFNLINTAVGSTASFTIHGIVRMDGQETPVAGVVGTYTTQFTGQSYQQLLATISRGGAVRASYSANFVVTPEGQVPEPSTAYMALGGVMIAAAALRRKLFQK